MRLSRILLLTVFVAGCHKQPAPQAALVPTPAATMISAPQAVAATSAVVNDMCWRPQTKRSMQDALNGGLDSIFADLKGQMAAFDAITASPRTVTVEDFGLQSVDASSGRLVCDAWVTVTFNTKRHGLFTVPKTSINFDISQTEKGQDVTFQDVYFVGFMQSFRDRLKKIGIKLNVS